MHLARLLATIINTSGKAATRHIRPEELILDYLREPEPEPETDNPFRGLVSKIRALQGK